MIPLGNDIVVVILLLHIGLVVTIVIGGEQFAVG